MSLESIIIIVVMGLVSGWLAGVIWKGSGFGIVGNIVIGVVGAFIGSWVFQQLGISIGHGILSSVISSVAGALILLFVIGLIKGRR